jgi:hypothetical protein
LKNERHLKFGYNFQLMNKRKAELRNQGDAKFRFRFARTETRRELILIDQKPAPPAGTPLLSPQTAPVKPVRAAASNSGRRI